MFKAITAKNPIYLPNVSKHDAALKTIHILTLILHCLDIHDVAYKTIHILTLILHCLAVSYTHLRAHET